MSERYKSYRVLAVDDDPAVLDMLEDMFMDDYTVETAESAQAAIDRVTDHPGFAVVIMDIKMPGTDGIKAAGAIRELDPQTAIVFHTGHPGEYDEAEIDRTQRPYEYINKGRSIDRLERVVRNAVEQYVLKQDKAILGRIAESDFGITGRSTAMQDIYLTIKQAAANDNAVMIRGETGTGKELVAHAIHKNSARRDKPFLIFDCSSKKELAIEIELFGVEDKVYTEVRARAGLFETANGGTVFLDEIGELDESTQVKLLGVLERKTFKRLGSQTPIQSDFRLLSATHRDLEQMVKDGQFREDLFYRLQGITIGMPPLRSRREDIPALIQRFAIEFSAKKGIPYKIFDDTAVRLLIEHEWPGNVRQLLDTVESLIVLTDSEIIVERDVERYLDRRSGVAAGGYHNKVKQFKRTLIIQALVEAGYRKTKAAELLQIDRTTLYKLSDSLGIDLDGPGES